MSDSVTCDTFERNLRNLHLCEKEQLDKEEKFSKPLSVINKLNKRFLSSLSVRRKNRLTNPRFLITELMAVGNE